MNEEKIADKVFSQLQKLVPPESLEKVVLLLTQKLSREKTKVVVTLASPPSEALMIKVGDVVEKTYGPDAVIEYRINPQIVGGLILEGQGKFYDHSVGNRINGLFKK